MRVLIYDDELLFSEVLSSLLLQRGHVVSGCPTSPAALIELATVLDSDVCLMSVPESISFAVDLVRKVKDANDRAVVVMTSRPDADLLWRVLEAGSDGACLKVDPVDEIERVLIRTADAKHNGFRATSPVLSRGASAIIARRRSVSTAVTLTPKEQSVLAALVLGESTADIASDLGVREATIRTHLQHLFNKFGVHSRLALVAQAIQAQVVTVGDNSLSAIGTDR